MAPNPLRGDEDASADQGTLKGLYKVRADRPLRDLDCPPALAFAVDHVEDGEQACYALICDPKLPMRSDFLAGYRRLEHINQLQLLDWGVINWPLEGRRCMALIYERPHGARLMASLSDEIEPFTEDRLVRDVLRPLSHVLAGFADLRVPHRGVRPTNLFRRTPDGEVIALGDGLAMPAGAAQPVVCETVENGMAHPAGRGYGTLADDMYALGVTLAILLQGRNPMAGLSDQQIIQRKLELGSFQALMGEHRVSQGLMEPLRGLLGDNPQTRWTMEELHKWLDGHRQSPRQGQLPRRTQRPMSFAGVNYHDVRSLGFAFQCNWTDGLAAVRQDEFKNWAARSIDDNDQSERIIAACERGGVGGGVDRLLGHVCIALDPLAPVRFKGIGVNIVGGLGPALAAVMDDSASRQSLVELILSGLAPIWLADQHPPISDAPQIAQQVDQLVPQLNSSAIGAGVERCLYMLNPALPCLSTIVESEFVDEPERLLAALERVAGRSPRPSAPIDRHIAAFIAVRSKMSVSSDLARMDSRDKGTSALGMLRILAGLQNHYGIGPVPQLAAWLAELLKPAISQYRNLALRKDMEAAVRSVTRAGKLTELVRLVDNPNLRQRDEAGYQWACQRHQQIVAKIRQLELDEGKRSAAAEHLGGQIAASVSSLLASASGMAMLIIQVM
ncbi:MAG: hypothetical protein QNJ92_11010 [Alphaproteobacteria bacterium]|nr:hypothetical protein [Alphaproteobacteria bacterium]